MRPWRLAVALLIGALVGCVVMVWPVRPLWTSDEEPAARPLGFTRDGTVLITLHFPDHAKPAPYFCRWNSATGELLAKIRLAPFTDQPCEAFFYLLEDHETSTVGFFNGNDSNGMQFSLYSSTTGERLTPWTKTTLAIPTTMSTDGRWYCLQHATGRPFADLVEIIDLETGRAVLACKPGQGLRPMTFYITPDGSEVVMAWLPTEPKEPQLTEAKRETVVIHALPSGRELRRFQLPLATGVLSPRSWDGRYLEFLWWRREANKPLYEVVRVDAERPLSLDRGDPWLTEYVEGDHKFQLHRDWGETWAAYMSSRPSKTFLDESKQWLYQRLNWKLPPLERDWLEIRVRDRTTGRVRQTVPRLVKEGFQISPDGRFLASATDTGLVMWDLDPIPRWMKSVVVAVGAAGLYLFAAYFRSCRKARRGRGAGEQLRPENS